MSSIAPSSPETGHQATETTGMPLTLDAALLRIAELEQEIRRLEQLSVSAKLRGLAEKVDEHFRSGLRGVVADAVEGKLAELAGKLSVRPEALAEAVAGYLPAAQSYAADMGDELLSLDSFLADLDEKITEEAPTWERQMAADEGAEANSPATEEKETAGDVLSRLRYSGGILGDAARLGRRILEATEAGRNVSAEAGTPEASEIAAEKIRVAHALLGLATAVDSTRPAEIPELIAGALAPKAA